MTVATKERKGVTPPGAEPPIRIRRWRWVLPALGILAWLLVGGPLGGLAGKTSDVQKNDNAAFLPKGVESWTVLDFDNRLSDQEAAPAILVYSRDSGLTEADRQTIIRQASGVRAGTPGPDGRPLPEQTSEIAAHLGDKLAGPPIGPIFSEDGKAAQVILQFAGSDSKRNGEAVTWIRDHIGTTDGLAAHVTGPVGIFADFMEVFKAIDGVLLLATGGIILLILLVVYRSPILPVVVLAVSGLGLGVANGIVYLLAKAEVVDLSGQSQAILDVLVLGAATDYALLLVSRFREELRHTTDRFDAMKAAWRAVVEPIVASATTVVIGLLCLLFSDLSSNRGLGPVGAIGIACALAVSLTLLPLVLVLIGRAAFWPFRPAYGSKPAEEHGLWARVAGLVGRRPRLIWVATLLILVASIGGLTRLEANGIPQTESFTTSMDSKVGQDLVGRHFPGGSGSPAEVIVRADRVEAAVTVIKAVPGVASAEPFTGAIAPPLPGQPLPEPRVLDGMVRIDATLTDAADSPAASKTIVALREAVHAIPGADAKVGGFTAMTHDIQTTSQRDRKVILPLVLVVIFFILMLLLRSLIAPLLLIATVVLSYLATLGISGIVFSDVLDFPGADSAYPLFAFVFLVALGVDYNIFLMTRVREEAGKRGHRAGTLAGLSVTGGVITSAGIVLAATFAALAVLPLVFVVQIAFAVAFGVLLDTLLVRSLLVPALTIDIGRFVWWPGRLRRTEP